MNLGRFDKKSKIQETEAEAQLAKSGITSVAVENGCVTVFLSGKIDATNFEEVQDTAEKLVIENEDAEVFVFDMDGVSYVSSAGLRMFSAINHKISEKNATKGFEKPEMAYKLTNMRDDITKLFQMTGYASAFCIESKKE